MLASDLKLSLRAANCLEAEGISTVRDLVSRSREELLEVRNFGETTLQEIEEKLAEIGLKLGMQMPSTADA
jgi:DNA-directed RNA polymerase subunit alpha